MKMKKNGFTIVELLMVVTVLAILASIITMGVNGMFRSARRRSAVAMKQVLQSGLETYYAQHGEWPSGIKSHLDEDEDSYELKVSEVDAALTEIVFESVKSSGGRCIDPTGLFVADQGKVSEGCHDNHRRKKNKDFSYEYCGNKRCLRGRQFTDATKKGDGHISVKQMAFGYAGPNNGCFCRFRVIFHPRTDTVEVKMQQITEDNKRDD